MTTRPLSARSILLSLLLGAHPAEMTSAALVRVATDFAVSESTARVALTRLVASGDLIRDKSTYRLNDRLLARQRRQDSALDPEVVRWDGRWEIVTVVTAGARSPEDRAALRSELVDRRLAELREGVWLRPANLRRESAVVPQGTTRFVGTSDVDPRDLVAQLWDLDTWASTGSDLLESLSSTTDPAERMAVAAAVVRHLTTDPILPPKMQPSGWPASDLRKAYTTYVRALSSGITSV